mgnify:FL=1|tara:strand:+ start:200 stop:412 length:213 start_codon:yes stop_codon:yes gene_type:complete
MSAIDTLKQFYPPGSMVQHIETGEVAVIIEWTIPEGKSDKTPLRELKVLKGGELVRWKISALNKWKPRRK